MARWLKLLIIAFSPLILFASCPKQSVDATVSCGNFGRADTDLGVLNIAARADLGDLMWVDQKNRRVVRVMSIEPPATIDEAKGDLTKIVKAVQMTSTVSAEIPLTVKAKLDQELAARTEIVVRNLREKKVTDPLKLLNADDDVRINLSSKPDTLWLFGQGIGIADAASLTLSRANQASADVDVFQYGKYTINVTYACNQEIGELANDGRPMFWRFLPVRFDSKTNTIVVDDSLFNPNEYSWVSAR